MAFHQLQARDSSGQRSFVVTLPKSDLRADGLLDLFDALDGGLPVEIRRDGPGAWTVIARPDRAGVELEDLDVDLDPALLERRAAIEAD